MNHNGHVFREEGGVLKLIGDFEGLYRSVEDPWGQSGESGPSASYYSFSRSRLVSALRRANIDGSGLEVGCGHGHVTALLNDLSGMAWEGLDISETAVVRATELHPHCRFLIGDIRDPDLRQPPTPYDVILLNQVLWYVLEKMDETIANCLRLLVPNGLLMVSQAFLRDEQHYGADIANGFQGTACMFLVRYGKHLSLIDARYADRGRLAFYDGLLVFRAAA